MPIDKKPISTVNFSLLSVTKSPVDSKKALAPQSAFTNISDLLTHLNTVSDKAYYEGFTLEDPNYSVTWELYKDGSTWKARLYDGTFYVDWAKEGYAINPVDLTPGSIDIEMKGLLSGMSENDTVLIYNSWAINGIWIVHESEIWERHPLFDDVNDNLQAITISVKQGPFKRSQWRFKTLDDINHSPFITSPNEMWNDPETFYSYTPLYFEIISNTIESYSNHFSPVFKDLFLIGGTTNVLVHNLLPFVDYTVKKSVDDSSLLYVTVNSINSFDFDKIDCILKDITDWRSYKLLEQIPDYIGTSSFVYGSSDNEFLSTDKLMSWGHGGVAFQHLTSDPISADGQLSISIPDGYTLVRAKVITETYGTADAALKLGTSPDTDDIADSITVTNNGTVELDDLSESASGSDTDLYIADYSTLGAEYEWNGNTVTVEILVIEN